MPRQNAEQRCQAPCSNNTADALNIKESVQAFFCQQVICSKNAAVDPEILVSDALFLPPDTA
jgi:hypothetical protein